MIDFSYNGEKLSDYGCIVVSINTLFSNSVPLGSNITFDTIRNRASYQNKIINAKYDDVITATFDVCKNPCSFHNNEMAFSSGEISYFMRWLNQKVYYKFKPIYENGNYSDIYFYGTFTTISAIVIGGNIIGFTLTFTANSPFGYVDDKEFTAYITESKNTFIFYDDSDEIGSLYPYYFKIDCLSDGRLEIQNDRDSKSTVIQNCKNGESIIMNCENKIITSSKAHTTLYNDFNYNYPRIINSFDNRKNVFTVSKPCNITIKYAPTRKAGIIV